MGKNNDDNNIKKLASDAIEKVGNKKLKRKKSIDGGAISWQPFRFSEGGGPFFGQRCKKNATVRGIGWISSLISPHKNEEIRPVE